MTDVEQQPRRSWSKFCPECQDADVKLLVSRLRVARLLADGPLRDEPGA